MQERIIRVRSNFRQVVVYWCSLIKNLRSLFVVRVVQSHHRQRSQRTLSLSLCASLLLLLLSSSPHRPCGRRLLFCSTPDAQFVV